METKEKFKIVMQFILLLLSVYIFVQIIIGIDRHVERSEKMQKIRMEQLDKRLK